MAIRLGIQAASRERSRLISRSRAPVVASEKILGMHRVVYVSRACPCVLSNGALEIATCAQDWNSAHEVTGLLLFDGERFLQAVEGPRQAVLPLMDRIGADRRHQLVQIVENRPVQSRLFPDWSMRFKHVGEQQAGEDFLSEVKLATSRIENAQVQALFIGFATLGRRSN
jgi:hypothetical protein